MYEFWYDYMKKKYGDMVKLCYMETDSLIMNINTKGFYKDIARDIAQVIGLMKDELGGGIITEFVALRPKTYSYMTDEFIEMKQAKGTKKCIIKKMLSLKIIKSVYLITNQC